MKPTTKQITEALKHEDEFESEIKFTRFTLPLIRTNYPKFIANDLVVQATTSHHTEHPFTQT